MTDSQGQMTEANSFTLWDVSPCRASRCRCWLIGHEEAADERCLSTADRNPASFVPLRSIYRGPFPVIPFWLAAKTRVLRRELMSTFQITAPLGSSQQGSRFQFGGFWCDSFCVFGSFLAELCTLTLHDRALLRCCHDTYLESFVSCQLIKCEEEKKRDGYFLCAWRAQT